MGLTQAANLLLALERQQGVLIKPILIQGPFHQPQPQVLSRRKLLLPGIPGERLDFPVHQGGEAALHET